MNCLLSTVCVVASLMQSEPSPGDQAGEPKSVAAIVSAQERATIDRLRAYLADHADAPDRDQAYLVIFETAIKNDWFLENESIAATYLAGNPKGAVRPLAEVVVIMARAAAGEFGESFTRFQQLTTSLESLEQRDFVVSFAEQLTSQAVAAGEVEVATKLQRLVMNRFADDAQARENASAELARLEQIGKPAANLTLRGISGESLNLSALRGKVVIIDFWATYCVPCQVSIPELKGLHEAFRARGLEVISVSLDDEAALASEFMKARGVGWAQVHNATCEEDVVAAFRVRKIPSLALIDKQGRVVLLDARGEALRAAVERLLGPEAKALGR